jgi:Ca-activated chloride channel family protein
LKIGLEQFDSTSRVLVSPTSDRVPVTSAIDALQLGGGTATGDAIFTALDAIKALPKDANNKPAAAAIVLMSDGTPTIGRNGQSPEETVSAATAAAKDMKVPINTIAFGTPNGTVTSQGEVVPVPADPQAMQDIAKNANGKSFTASTAGQLNSVYEQIRRSVGYDSVVRDITAWFTGLGLLLAILTAAAALFWMQRIP